jgi:AcrR family transcriptional regulator
MPKIVDHDVYRKDLLERSFEIFAVKGYANLTMRELAKHLDVSTGTLYHYFPSKQSIFEQLVDVAAEQDVLSFAEYTATAKTLKERIVYMFDFLKEYEPYLAKQIVISVDVYRQMGASMLENPSVRRYCDAYEQQIRDYFQIDEDLAILISNLVTGIIFERMIEGERHSLDRQCEVMVDLLTTYFKHSSKNQQGKQSKVKGG